MKKLFLVSSVVLVIALILLGVYNVAFRNNINSPKVADIKTTNTKVPTSMAIKEDAIKLLADEKSISPSYNSSDNSVTYFVPESREVKRVSIDTPSVVVVMPLSGEPVQAVWSPLYTQALVQMKTVASTEWYLVDVDKKIETPLKQGIEQPIWTSLGDKIVYKYYDVKTKERSLSIANPDGSDWKKIGDSPFQNMSSTVTPQGSLFVFWNTANAFEETSLRSMSLIGGDVKTLFSGKFGVDYRYAPDGQKILISSTNQKGGTTPALGLLLNQGTQYQNLGIPSLTTKTAWSKNSKTLYYALPGSLPADAVMPNDYFSKPLLTQDTFWKVSVETGEKKRIVETRDITKNYDVSSVMVNDDETMLVFVNRIDGKLYSIAL
jgi:hypothetical protein